MNQKIINLTGYDIVMLDNINQELFRIKPSGEALLLPEKRQFMWDKKVFWYSVPVSRVTYGWVPLPEAEENTIYVVNRLVAEYVNKHWPSRTDFYYLGQKVIVNGKVKGVKGLMRF